MATVSVDAKFIRAACIWLPKPDTFLEAPHIHGVHFEPGAKGGVNIISTESHNCAISHDPNGTCDEPCIMPLKDAFALNGAVLFTDGMMFCGDDCEPMEPLKYEPIKWRDLSAPAACEPYRLNITLLRKVLKYFELLETEGELTGFEIRADKKISKIRMLDNNGAFVISAQMVA